MATDGPAFDQWLRDAKIDHPKASRWDILNFIERTWKVCVSTVALYHFMKK